MHISIRKIGNSEGVIIPKEVLNRHGLKAGDEIELSEEQGKIVLRPVNASLSDQLKAARVGMEKYKVALRELAK